MTFSATVFDQFAKLSARHKEPSVIASMDDDPAKPTQRLVDLTVGALSRIASTPLTIFEGRPSTEPRWFDTWPGSITGCWPPWSRR